MEGGLRRIRGAVGMGLTWAVAWGLVGFGIDELSPSQFAAWGAAGGTDPEVIGDS